MRMLFMNLTGHDEGYRAIESYQRRFQGNFYYQSPHVFPLAYQFVRESLTSEYVGNVPEIFSEQYDQILIMSHGFLGQSHFCETDFQGRPVGYAGFWPTEQVRMTPEQLAQFFNALLSPNFGELRPLNIVLAVCYGARYDPYLDYSQPDANFLTGHSFANQFINTLTTPGLLRNGFLLKQVTAFTGGVKFDVGVAPGEPLVRSEFTINHLMREYEVLQNDLITFTKNLDRVENQIVNAQPFGDERELERLHNYRDSIASLIGMAMTGMGDLQARFQSCAYYGQVRFLFSPGRLVPEVQPVFRNIVQGVHQPFSYNPR